MGNAFILIVVGLLLFYVVISDKFYCLEGCFACLAGRTPAPGSSGPNAAVGVATGGALVGRAGGAVPSVSNLIGY